MPDVFRLIYLCGQPVVAVKLLLWRLPEVPVSGFMAVDLYRSGMDLVEKYIFRDHQHLLQPLRQRLEIRICAHN